jgi:hypothetical protein
MQTAKAAKSDSGLTAAIRQTLAKHYRPFDPSQNSVLDTAEELEREEARYARYDRE